MATSITSWRRGTPSRAMQLEGKRALITGAGSGIGRALAIEASRLGMTVALCGRRAEALYATLSEMTPSGRHLRLRGDITDPAVQARHARLSVAHSGAGSTCSSTMPASSPSARLPCATDDELERVMATNVVAPIGLDPGDAAAAPPGGAVAHRQCRLHVRRHRLSAVRGLFGVEIRPARALDCAAARAQALTASA